MGEAIAAPCPLEPSPEGKVHFDNDLIREVEDYTEGDEMERDNQPQTTMVNIPQTLHPTHTRSSISTNASTGGTGPSTREAQVPVSSS